VIRKLILCLLIVLIITSGLTAFPNPWNGPVRAWGGVSPWNANNEASFSPLDIPSCVFYAPLDESNEVLGSDIVTNGDFSAWTADNPDSWSLGAGETGTAFVTQVGNACRMVSSDASIMYIYQVILTTGSRYRSSLDISAITGTLVAQTYDGVATENTVGSYTTTGSKSADFTAVGNQFLFKRGGVCDATFTNAVIQQLTTADLVSSNNGTFPNGISYGTGRGGESSRAMVFDGVNQSTSFTLTGVNIKSFSAWVYLDDNTTRDIIDFNGAASVAVDGSGNVALTGIAGGTVYVNGVAGVAVPASTWTNIIVTATTTIAGGACEFGYAGATYIDGNAQDIVLGSDVFSAGTIANLQGDY
jgi:hypothetical protein